MTVELQTDKLKSPVGKVTLVSRDGKLVVLDFEDNDERIAGILKARFGDFRLKRVRNPHGFTESVQRYFDGELNALDKLATDPGGTPFQAKVWKALTKIRCGRTESYGDLASRIGRPTASRAVGAANGRNPVALVLPCHRVVGSNGTLTGYAGGIHRKEWLLKHEGALLL